MGKMRRPPSTERYQGKDNKMTKIANTGIYYSDSKMIGQGATSVVYAGYFNTPTCQAAVKRVSSKHVDIVTNEIGIWQTVNESVQRIENANVVQLFRYTEFLEGVNNKEIYYYFAMEKASFCLEKWIENFPPGPDPCWRTKVIGYLNDAVKGLSWLHSKRVIHRDIKPGNILIFCEVDNGRGIAKLGDFGISKRISEMCTGTDSIGKGSTDWMSPETIEAMSQSMLLHHTKAVDIFSLGMTAYYAISGGIHPFETSDQYGRVKIMNIKDRHVSPSKLGNGEHSADHLFQWMMEHSPEERPRILQVQHHPLFWDSMKQLNFILDIAKSLDIPKDKAKSLLDAYYQHNIIANNLNWISVLTPPVYDMICRRASSDIRHSYKGKSVSSLIKLIRDKNVHFGDLLPQLITEQYFGSMDANGIVTFSEEKYAEFFLNKFPHLVVTLFVFLVKGKGDVRLKTFNPVKIKYQI